MPKTITVKTFKGIDQIKRRWRWSYFYVECLMTLDPRGWSSRRHSQEIFAIDANGLSRSWISSHRNDIFIITSNNYIGIGDEWEIV